jgi:antitoxin (DNA-binding transcriptional repressor) of toxin-antitoxin stability system
MARKRDKSRVVREAAAGYGVTEVPASELKNDWHRWLQRVSEGGQTLIVTRYGKPIATLSPVRSAVEPRRIFGALAGSVTEEADLISPTGESWDAEG